MRIFEQLGPHQNLGTTFRRAPLADWHPKQCGTLDVRIDRHGIWWHEGQPIRRSGLIRVLASILMYEDQQWWLKSPVEQLSIEVEDAPFLITEYDLTDDAITLTTNVGETVELHQPWQLTLDPDGEWRPWIQLHEAIGARLSRSLYTDLIDQAFDQTPNGSDGILYWTAGCLSMPLGHL